MSEQQQQKQIGDIINNLGVVADIEDDDLVTDAIVILRVTSGPAHDGIILCASSSMSHIVQSGMVVRASDIVRFESDAI